MAAAGAALRSDTMKRLTVVALICVMFCVPFLLMATGYEAAPVQLPVLRVGIGHTALWATKSLFMVFRVPLMNLLHGIAVNNSIQGGAGWLVRRVCGDCDRIFKQGASPDRHQLAKDGMWGIAAIGLLQA